MFKTRRIENFVRKKPVILFITTNYLVTCLLYTSFELSSGHPTFGLYGNMPFAWHSFGTNIIVHYLMTAFVLVMFCRLATTGKITYKACILISLYLILYYLAVRLYGKYYYVIEWYPYVIFSPDSLWQMLNSGYNQTGAVVLSIAVNVFLFFAYFALFILLAKVKKRIKSYV